jgi:hypothetical protein
MTKKLIRFLPIALWCFSLPFASEAKADTFLVIEPTDITITIQSPQNFTVRTYAQEYGIDSQLWLYDGNNNLLVSNDDWFGLDSYISINLDPGVYRLRASVCCGNPDAWYGVSYRVETNISGIVGSTTTTSTTSTTTSTTTTIAPYLNSPQNIQITSVNESKVYLSWDAPEQSNVEVERYAIFFSCNNWENGYAISSTVNSAVVENLDSDTLCEFKIRADNDTLQVYSDFSNIINGRTSPTTTTTTTSTTTTTTTSTTTTTLPVIIVPETTWPATTTSTTTTTTSTTTAPTTTVPATTTTSTTVPESTTTVQPSTTLAQDTTPNTEVPDTTLPDPESAVVSNLDVEQIAEVLSPENLEELSDEEVSQLIENLAESDLTDEQATAVAEALSDAPIEVKEEFEDQINIFSGQFDVYVPIGSNINVGQRRVLVAATAVAFTMPAGMASQSSASGRKKQ